MNSTGAKRKSKSSPVEPQALPVECPLGEVSCDSLTEIVELRSKVDELTSLVRTDLLTGLANFRHFIVVMDQEMERTRRTALPMALVMLDLDHFKKINDTYGHGIGNDVLAHVARLISGSVRLLDVPCRYGGEEFAIVLPNTDLRGSVVFAERLRTLIETTPLMVEGHEIALTASFGIEVYDLTQTATTDEVIERADSYLYQAKQEGRNRICHAPIEEVGGVELEEREELMKIFSELRRENPTPEDDQGIE